MTHLISLILACTVLLPPALAASADEWKSRSIYQLVTDRFANSNPSAQCNSEDRAYCGGTYKDVIAHLDYIQGMGFDAVWISPHMKNVEGKTAQGFAYHGYWPSDIGATNDHFGSADDLKSLSQELHKRGMYLMLDVIVNHLVTTPTSQDIPQSFDFSSLSLKDANNFHSQCFITDYNNQTQVEQCWLGDQSMPLLDINTEDTTIASSYNTWIADQVKQFSADGVRIDTVKHVRPDFWKDFSSSAGVFTLGEVLQGDPAYLRKYTEVMDNVLDYASWFPLTDGFRNSSGSMSTLASTYTSAQTSFSKGLFTAGSFLENHDNPRFQSHTTDSALVANAMTWPFVNDAIPILYYGSEQGYQGAADPFNREALWFSNYATDKPLVKLVTSLNKARKLAIKKNAQYTSTQSRFLQQSNPNVLAISKAPLLTLLTNSQSASWTVPGDIFGSGATVVDLISCNTVNVGGGEVKSQGGMPMVLVDSKQLDGSVCPGAAGSSSNGGGALRFGGVGAGLLAAAVGLVWMFI